MLVLLVSVLSGSILTSRQKDAEALSVCLPCVFCPIIDPIIAAIILELMEEFVWTPLVKTIIRRHMNQEQNWIVEDFFEDFWLRALAELTNFLSTFGMYQVEMVGAFFDAKNQLETRRLFFELQAEAHKDYHPSDDFCWFGTSARSLASSDSRVNLNMLAMSEISLSRQLGFRNTVAASGADDDKNSRWQRFVDTYCDPRDNSWESIGTGLDFACDIDGLGAGVATGAVDRARINRDVDYTRLVDAPRTLDVDFSNVVISEDEEDVLSMAANLYSNNVPSRAFSRATITTTSAKKVYMDLRSVVAKRNVAESSFNAIVALKASGTNGDAGAATQPDVGKFMASIVKDLMPAGTPDDEIYAILGENPSYYAQLEVLSKKIYQNPDFFANLYDTPANVKRKSVAMKAISLMLDRALYESELRQEMILSVMLSSELNRGVSTIEGDLVRGKRQK
ncbi:MAG: hypothetical protein COA45_06140 [Zetaproteobacteria bacterium]|nr:MAG: hypothetical protein COA45_06140 [Zetaproteobacteria bacterium]